MGISEAKGLKAIEDENAKLKKLLTEQMLDAAALRELQKNGKAAAKRAGATHLQAKLRELASQRRRFDYRRLFILLRPEGEPAVIHVDQELDYEITTIAPSFEAFIRGLEDDEAFAP